jgi:hypothetical protein
MMTLLVAIRDCLVSMALAWVGVSLQAPRVHADANCVGEACQTQSQH